MFFVMMAAGCGDSNPAGSSPATPPAPLENAGTRAPDERPIILAFGDSLTAGSGLPAGSGYPEKLQKELDARGYNYRVVNAGVGGDTTGGGVARLQSAIRMKPEIVILELGGNDGLRGVPIEVMQSNLDELVAEFKNAGAQVLLAGMTLPRNFGPDYIASFEKVYPALASKHGVTLMPFFLEGVGGDPRLNLEDLIHPNEEGYRIVAANVLKYVEPLLQK
jgi:acyl-CoA thioesterase-1